jgi:pilus assembly protein CpaB
MKLRALGISVGVALAGALLLFVSMRRFREQTAGGAPIAVVVVTQDVPPGTVLTEEMLGMRAIPQSYVEERQIEASEARSLIGLRTIASVGAGQSLLWTDLDQALEGGAALSGIVGSGMRAVTIRVAAGSAFDGLLRAGDRVDVLHTIERDGARVTSSLLQNALVLAVGGVMARQTEEASTGCSQLVANRVTVAVSLDQGQVLFHAGELGELHLALRNPDDIAVVDGLPETTDADVLGLRPTTERRRGLVAIAPVTEPALPRRIEGVER